MKIAFIGSQEDRLRDLTKKFLNEWDTFVCPSVSIFDDEIDIPEDIGLSTEKINKFNEVEKDLYLRMCFLEYQMDKYKEEKNVVWTGSTLDILALTMIHREYGGVSDDFVETIIYKNKKIIKKLDLIYWMPSEKFFTEPNEEEIASIGLDEDGNKKKVEIMTVEEQLLEIVYNNIWNDYVKNFEDSIIFPKKCPGIALFETTDPIDEIRGIVTHSGNLTLNDEDGQAIEKLTHAIRDKRLLKNVMEILKKPSIPLLGN